MEILGLIGIAISIIVLIYLAVKGVNVVIAAPIAAIIIIISNRMDFFPSLIGTENSYLTGVTSYIVSLFAVFFLGAIFAKLIDTSGAALSISQKVLHYIGTDSPYAVLIAIYLITAFLTYGGVSLFIVVFVLTPLAKPLFKKLNIAWNIAPLPMVLGFGTFTMTMLPGTPAAQNVIPTQYLGTTLTAAPVLGIIGSIVAIITSLWYMKYVLKKSMKKGENFSTYSSGEDIVERDIEQIPSFARSVSPLLLLIFSILVGSFFKVNNILLIGLVIAIILSIVLFRNYIKNLKGNLNTAATSSVNTIFVTAAVVGFGAVVTNAPGFESIKSALLSIPGNPLISLAVAASLFGLITGSASGTIPIVLKAFANDYLAMGIAPEVIHRVTSMSSAWLTNMPHSGVVLTIFSVTGLNHKNGLKYITLGFIVSNLSALIVVLIAAMLLY